MDRKSFITRLIALPAALLGINTLTNAKPKVFEPAYPFDLPDMNPNLIRKYPRTLKESYSPGHTIEEGYFHTNDGSIIHYVRGIEKTESRFEIEYAKDLLINK